MKELTRLRGEQLRRVHRHLQFVAQDPKSSLDPRMTIRDIIAEPLVIHGLGSRVQREARVRELLDMVGLPRSVLVGYPAAVLWRPAAAYGDRTRTGTGTRADRLRSSPCPPWM